MPPELILTPMKGVEEKVKRIFGGDDRSEYKKKEDGVEAPACSLIPMERDGGTQMRYCVGISSLRGEREG